MQGWLFWLSFGFSFGASLGLTACGSEPSWQVPADLAPPEPAAHVCAAMQTHGAETARGVAVDLAVAHADIRVFSPAGDWTAADQALAAALEPADALDQLTTTLTDYAAPLPDVCATIPEPGPLGPGSVTRAGSVAIVLPGTDDLQLPAGIGGVVIDLRQMPASADASDAVARAIGLALTQEATLVSRVRRLNGFPDQTTTSTVYGNSVHRQTSAIPATGGRTLPLAFVTPPRLQPAVATLVGHMRLSQRAWLLGHDILAAVAESRWSPVGDQHGLMWRYAVHEYPDRAGQPWPDRIPADIASTRPDPLFEQLPGLPTPPPVPSEVVGRPIFAQLEIPADAPTTTDGRGMRRAMLMTAHGTLDRFYPYFDVVGHDIDDALVAGLVELDQVPIGQRTDVVHALGRFMHSIRDGHGFFWDLAPQAPIGYLDVQIDLIAGEPMLRLSNHPGLLAGDTVVAIDGTPASEWFDEAMSRHSATSEHYLFDVASRELLIMTGERELTLRDADGLQRTVRVSPRPELTMPLGGVARSSGWLVDLGEPDVLYLNLDQRAVADWEEMERFLSLLPEARAAIVDMRGYPGVDHYQVARYLRTETFSSPLFEVFNWLGPERGEWQRTIYDLTPLQGGFDGPIVVLLGHKSVSAAENFLLMLADADNVMFVGQPTAATNGNITRATLPGGYLMMFTGMRVLYPDGSRFHGVGVVPDIEIEPTPAQLRAGTDVELQAGLTALP